MPTITAIKPQRKKDKRFNIFVEGRFALGLDAETLVKSGLKVGQEISEERIEKLILTNETNKLLEKALRFLASRPRSEREIRDYLKSKVPAHSTPLINKVLERLQRLGYVNDREFAQWWVEQRRTHRPRGIRLIRRELFQKGLVPEIIEQVLEELDNPKEEFRQALTIAQKRARTDRSLSPFVFRRRLSQFLLRRGFDWDVVNEVLEALR